MTSANKQAQTELLARRTANIIGPSSAAARALSELDQRREKGQVVWLEERGNSWFISGPYDLNNVIVFLNGIGIPCKIVEGATGFVPKIRIVAGTLEIDPECRVGNLLHEAGHLAITPAKYRHLMDGDLYAGMQTMLDDISSKKTVLDPDAPQFRAAIQCTDTEATAWAWAAGLHLGLDPKTIIEPDSYDGAGDDIRIGLQAKAYAGINGLQHAGFCAVNARSAFGRPVYPALAYWTQK